MKLPLRIILFTSTDPSVKPLDPVAPAPVTQPVDPGILAAAESKLNLPTPPPPSGFQAPPHLTEADLSQLPPLKRLALGMAALNSLTHFLPPAQLKVTRDLIRTSEERDCYIAAMLRLAAFVEAMPSTYGTQDQSDPYVWLHYFGGNYDSWFIEKDKGAKDDPVKGAQHQAYGYVRWSHMPDCAETGYISLPEVFKAIPYLNLDYHFTPCRLSELKAKLDGREEDDQAA